MVIKAFPPSSCKKQINKQNPHLLLAFLQSGFVPELDMHESKHFLPGPFVQCEYSAPIQFNVIVSQTKFGGLIVFAPFLIIIFIFIILILSFHEA